MNTDFHLFPEQASTVAPRVDALFWFIFAVCAFFTLIIAVGLMFFAVRYRRRTEDYFPRPVVGSKTLETIWSVVPLALALFIFFWSASLYFEIARPPDNALEIYVTGRQWMWHLQHPGGQREIVGKGMLNGTGGTGQEASTGQFHIPVGRPVKLIMTSEDVVHSFFIPAFRTKQDAVPGMFTYSWFQATRTGRFRLFCAEYCGTGHSQMIGEIVVLEPAEYEQWLSERADRSLALQGRNLFQKLQCVTCHHPEAGNRAPILEGIYGRRVEIDGSRPVLADESYLRESILYPANKVRSGWRPIMPPYKGQVSEDDLIRLIAFLKGLGPGQTPPRVEDSPPPAVEDRGAGNSKSQITNPKQ